jgi:hypothetical protein
MSKDSFVSIHPSTLRWHPPAPTANPLALLIT